MGEDTDYIEEALGLLGLKPPSDKDFDEHAFMASFLAWEAETDDTIDFKRAYVDMAGGDVLCGPGAQPNHLLGICLEKTAAPSYPSTKQATTGLPKSGRIGGIEIRLSARQVDRCLKILVSRKLIIMDNFRFNGLKTLHVRID